MSMKIKIRMGAAHSDVTFTDRRTGQSVVMDRTEMFVRRDRAALAAVTHHVIEETECLKDRDRRRTRRYQAERVKAARKDRSHRTVKHTDRNKRVAQAA